MSTASLTSGTLAKSKEQAAARKIVRVCTVDAHNEHDSVRCFCGSNRLVHEVLTAKFSILIQNSTFLNHSFSFFDAKFINIYSRILRWVVLHS